MSEDTGLGSQALFFMEGGIEHFGNGVHLLRLFANTCIIETDEGELGFSYSDVDRLLFAMIDERRSDEELASMGFELRFLRSVQTMVQRSQFKRRPPVVAKVSHRTVNVDFRYARDWGI